MAMNLQEQQTIQKLYAQYEEEQLRRLETQNALSKMSIVPQSQNELNIVTQQLDLSQELDRLYHLINGHVIRKDTTSEYWDDPDDDRLKTFSEYGAKQIFNYILFYINKNTLLSNFTEDMINEKMMDFGNELNDWIHNMYEFIFYYPSPEKMFREKLEIISKNPSSYPHLILMDNEGNNVIDEETLYAKCIEWSKYELQIRLRHFPLIMTVVTDSVHATMLRALNGEERDSLRKYMQIHQNISSNPLESQPKGLFGGLLKR